MDNTIVLAGFVFLGMFFAWVVLPSVLKSRAERSEEE